MLEPGLCGSEEETIGRGTLVGKEGEEEEEDWPGLEWPRNDVPAPRLALTDLDARKFDDKPELVPGLRWTPPAGTVGMVDNRGF